MRKENSEFVTKYISEAGSKKVNKDYFGFVELDKYICFVVANSLDNSDIELSSKIVVDSIINDFTNKPTMSKSKLKKYVKNANEQLEIQSIKFKLKASVLIVVSDYQKLRYVSCGNTNLSIFRGNNLFLRSDEQSVYRHMVKQKETYENSEVGLLEGNNLYNYLGKDVIAKSKASKKIKLQQDDVLLMSTWGFWNKVNDIEAIDAVEAANDTNELVGTLQDLFLSKQDAIPNVNNEVDNYTVITTFVNKLYVDKSNKKKYIKIGIIVTVIVLIIVAIILFFNYRSNKKRDIVIDTVTTYETKADIFLEDENYQRALDLYSNAVNESESLTKKTGKKGIENTEIKDRLSTKEYVSSLIIDAENLYKDQSFEDAKSKYKAAISEIEANFEVFYELEVDIDYLKLRVENCDSQIYLLNLIDVGTQQKDSEQFDEAKITLEEAKSLAIAVGNKVVQKEVNLLLKELTTEKKTSDEAAETEAKEEEEKLNDEVRKTAESAIAEGDNAVLDGNYDVAEEAYNSAIALYRTIPDMEGVANTQKLISDMKIKQKEEKNATKYAEGENYITIGDSHFSKSEVELARNNYNAALNIFTNLQDKDYMLIVRTKLSEVDSAEAKIENDLKIKKADDYVKKGDEDLGEGDYTNAKKQYKLAQIAYQDAGNIDKVLEMDKKISAVEELEKM